MLFMASIFFLRAKQEGWLFEGSYYDEQANRCLWQRIGVKIMDKQAMGLTLRVRYAWAQPSWGL